MLKKSILSLAVAATLAGMTGCQISSVEGNDKVDKLPVDSGKPDYIAPEGTRSTAPIFNPAAGLLPLQIDVFFSGTTDGTLFFDERGGDIAVGATGYSPVVSAMQDMDGFSTGGFIDIPFSASLNADSIVKFGPGIQNPNVLLVPVKYADGDDVVTDSLANGDAPTGFGIPVSAEITAITYVGDSHKNSVLRIAPKAPLEAKTRYLVIITDGIKDSKGDAITVSGAYDDLTSDRVLVDPGLNPLRTAVNGWEDMAAAFLPAIGSTQTKDNIALAYTFTTGGTLDVLSVMAAPGNANPLLIPDAQVTALSAAIDPSLSDDDNKARIASAIAGSQTPPVSYATLKATVASNMATDDQKAQAQGAIDLFDAGALKAFSVIDLGIRPRSSDFTGAVPTTTILLSERATINDMTANSVATFVDGKIKLPYYLEAPDLATNVATAGRVLTSKWAADTNLATNLENPALTAPSNRVTRLFPFAKKTGYVDAPLLVVVPTNGACATPYPVVIYQHGIFSDRTSGIKLSEEFAADCKVTIAIDMAYHGVTPTDMTDHLVGPAKGTSQVKFAALLASKGVAASPATVGAATAAERHFGLTQGADGLPAAMSGTVAAANKSGAFAMNLVNFQGTRDAFRQSIMDLLNLNASIATIDFNNDGTPDLDATNVHFVGVSFGGIIGTAFATVNNSSGLHMKNLIDGMLAPGPFVGNANLPPLKTVTLAVTGGSLAKLTENSNTFGPQVVGALAGAPFNIAKGSENYEKYMQIFQGALDSMDPINFAGTLGQIGTPVYMIESIGDNAVPNSAADAPLVGTAPLAAVLGATQIDESIAPGELVARKALVQFTDVGSNHTSVLGTQGDAAQDDTTFAEMFSQIKSFMLFSGTAITIGTEDDSQVVPAP
jgi:hypothetical protein